MIFPSASSRLAAALAVAIVAVVTPSPDVAAESIGSVPESLPGAPALPSELRRQLAADLAARGDAYTPRTRNLRDDGTPVYTNRLLLERSPYLQQHAHNPVNWYPWGDEAFEAARRLGRPVLVSIGYSTCHWCHVMEEESYDDPATAEILNQHFIAIKVDREARPDVDAIYMDALQAMNGNGGWPLNMWLTPDRRPFYGGTYFPPVERGGRPSFRGVLAAIHERYERDPARLQRIGDEVAAAIQRNLASATALTSQLADESALANAAALYRRAADRTWGGIGDRPKFPATLPVRFLLREHRRTGDEDALAIAVLALEKMAAGGMYDHVGGGFHRYSTDRRWLVPHFEKMLYDNALLAIAYLEASVVTGRVDFARVARETLDYVRREMTAPEGGFYSATDADSRKPDGEMEEGWFFTWTPAELEAAIGAPSARVVSAYYGVTAGGNYEGRNVLRAWSDPSKVAAELGISPDELRRSLAAARAALYEARAVRPAPLRDDKILAAWNGLMISAFARAALILDEPSYALAASRAADFALRRMWSDGRLRRVFLDGRAEGPAFLDDYAFLVAGLLDLYEVAPDTRWLREARALQATLDRHYADESGGGYYRTADDHEQLLVREKPARDGAIPSGNSVTALNLLRLAELTLDDAYHERAALLFSAFHPLLSERPNSVAEMLLALDYRLDVVKEIVIVRPPGGGDLAPLLGVLRSSFVPNRILAVATEGPDLEAQAEAVPLLAGRRARGGRVTAYVCENRVCKFPTSDPEVFAEQLQPSRPSAPDSP